jgi:hypothetical protein
MKKTITILLVLVIGMVGVFAAASSGLPLSTETSTVDVTSTVTQFALFGVTADTVVDANFASQALFSSAVNTNIGKDIGMLALSSPVEVGKLSGINSLDTAVSLAITTTDLVSGSNSIGLTVSPESESILAAASSAFGTLKNTSITLVETTTGAAALAPSGDYSATVTIGLTVV